MFTGFTRSSCLIVSCFATCLCTDSQGTYHQVNMQWKLVTVITPAPVRLITIFILYFSRLISIIFTTWIWNNEMDIWLVRGENISTLLSYNPPAAVAEEENDNYTLWRSQNQMGGQNNSLRHRGEDISMIHTHTHTHTCRHSEVTLTAGRSLHTVKVQNCK